MALRKDDSFGSVCLRALSALRCWGKGELQSMHALLQTPDFSATLLYTGYQKPPAHGFPHMETTQDQSKPLGKSQKPHDEQQHTLHTSVYLKF